MSWCRFFRRAHWDAERARELDSYLQIETDAQIARGLSPEDARAAARRKLGNATRIREEIYTMNSIGWLETLWQDLRHGARLLRLNPGFAAVAILSLALGVGANAAIFQLIDTVRLRALPVTDPGSLVEVRIPPSLGGTSGHHLGSRPNLTYPVWEQLRSQQQAFSSMAAWSDTQFDLSGGGEARYVDGLFVSGGYFQTLGVKPLVGRLLVPSDDESGCGSPGVVISYSFWQREFGGEPSAVGRTLTLEGHPLDIIGITPSGFFGVDVGRSFDVAVPLCADALFSVPNRASGGADTRSIWWLAALGRLKPGWTAERATSQLAAISPAIFRDTRPVDRVPRDVERYLTFTLAAFPAGAGISELRQQYDTPLWLLLGATALLLFITCANLANLMLARATARAREIAVRLALGASRFRIVRQLLAESLLIAVLGTALGAFVAGWLTQAIVGLLSTDSSRLFLDFQTDWRIFVLMGALAVSTSLLFGLAPALRATRTAPAEAMKTGGRGTTEAHERFGLRRALVVVQVALSLVLVVGALLFARTLQNLATVDLGFDTDGVVAVNLDLQRATIPEGRRIAVAADLVDRFRAAPGIDAAAQAYIVPLSGSGWNHVIIVDGVPQPGVVDLNRVSAGYFRTMRTPLVRGRDFDAHDTLSSPLVAIVTQSFAARFFGNTDPIGRSFQLQMPPGEPAPSYEVVGVAEDTKYRSLRRPFAPIAYFASTQDPEPSAYPSIVVRSRASLSTITADVAAEVAAVDPAIVVQFEPLSEDLRSLLLPERLMATLSIFFGLLAALLATIGLYGVLSYMVARRRNEIGIRMALGADARTVVGLILREAGLLVLAGLAIGTVLAAVSGRAASTLLYGLTASDPLTMATAALLLVTVAALASGIPAMRAARVDPNVALREE
jgi:predicted permease